MKMEKVGFSKKSRDQFWNRKGTENEILRFWCISKWNANAITSQNHLSNGFLGISYYFPYLFPYWNQKFSNLKTRIFHGRYLNPTLSKVLQLSPSQEIEQAWRWTCRSLGSVKTRQSSTRAPQPRETANCCGPFGGQTFSTKVLQTSPSRHSNKSSGLSFVLHDGLPS